MPRLRSWNPQNSLGISKWQLLTWKELTEQKNFFINLYYTSSEGMYSTDNFTWEIAFVQRVSAEIAVGTQTA